MNHLVRIAIIGIFFIGSIFSFNSCKKNATQPVVTTTNVTAITQTDASAGGNVISDGGEEVISRVLLEYLR